VIGSFTRTRPAARRHLRLPLASVGRRAWAFLIDFALAVALLVAVAIPAGNLWERMHPGEHAGIEFTFALPSANLSLRP
jgi:hypothetical protein